MIDKVSCLWILKINDFIYLLIYRFIHSHVNLMRVTLLIINLSYILIIIVL